MLWISITFHGVPGSALMRKCSSVYRVSGNIHSGSLAAVEYWSVPYLDGRQVNLIWRLDTRWLTSSWHARYVQSGSPPLALCLLHLACQLIGQAHWWHSRLLHSILATCAFPMPITAVLLLVALIQANPQPFVLHVPLQPPLRTILVWCIRHSDYW